MANPNFIKGGKSPNPEGRRKTRKSSRTIGGMLENFVKRNITANKLQTMYDKLQPKDQLYFLAEVLPYVVPRQSAVSLKGQITSLSDNDLEALYNRVTGAPTADTLPFEDIPLIPESVKEAI